MYEELIEELRRPHADCDPWTLMEQAADAIEQLQRHYCRHAIHNEHDRGDDSLCGKYKCEVNALPKWIPVGERLPEEEESVFVVRKFLGVKGQVPPSTYTEIAYRIGDRWVADSDEYKIARHRHTDPLYWMPLPQAPKEET